MNKIGNEVCRVGRFLLASLILAAGVQAVQADETRIKMLDTSASGPLAFEPNYLKARVGDTGTSGGASLVRRGGQGNARHPEQGRRVPLRVRRAQNDGHGRRDPGRQSGQS